VIADNKLAENAGWDQDLLRVEIADLSLLGFDMPLLGFNEKELSKLMKADDANPDASPQLEGLSYAIVVRCESEDEQRELLERFEAEGLTCNALIS
jgi:hypothetical protein